MSSSSARAHTKVSIGLLEARGLTAKDRNGLSDPFCEVRLVIGGKKEDPKYDTRVVEKSLSPVWKERFVFINERLCDASAQLVIKCFDANKLTAAVFMGIVTVPLHELLGDDASAIVEKWLPLQAYKGDIDVSGDLHVQLAWGELPLEKLDRATVLSPADQARAERNKQLELQQLRKLRGEDDGIKPVAETLKNLTNIGVVNDAKDGIKSLASSVHDGLAPVLPKQLRRAKDEPATKAGMSAAVAALAAREKAVEDERLKQVAADDADAAAMAAATGGAQRPLYYFVSQVLTEPLNAGALDDLAALRTEVEAALNVSSLGKLASALQRPRSTTSLLRNLLYRMYTLESHPVYAKNEWGNKKQYFAHVERQRDSLRECIRALVHPKGDWSGKLSVDVIEAQDLPPCDSNGLSDPYVLLSCGSETAKTKTEMRTLAPKWKDEKHVLHVASVTLALELSMWDWDTTSEDDFMGQIVVPIASLLDGVEVNKWFPLERGPPGKGQLHVALSLAYPYVEYWRAIDKDTELAACGLGGLADGKLGSLPSAIDLLLDCTSHVTELYQALLLAPPELVSVKTDADVFRRVHWLVEAYGERFGVPLSRRRLELVRLLVRAGNNNRLMARDVDPFAPPLPSKAPAAAAAAAAPPLWTPSDSVTSTFMAIAADPTAVRAVPDALLVEQVNNAVCDIRRQVAHSLVAIKGRDVCWDKALAARLAPAASLADSASGGKVQAPPSALTSAELALFCSLQLALAHQRFAVLRLFKTHYSAKSPLGALSANIETLREIVDKDDLFVLLHEAVQSATAHYHRMCAPVELQKTADGVLAVLTVVRQEIDEDEVYARAFPRDFGYVDATTAFYISDYRGVFARFCEQGAYEPAVFTVWEQQRELLQTLSERLSAEARARLPAWEPVKLFEPFVLQWLKECAVRLTRWTNKATEVDTREVMHEGVLFSAGIIDAFSGCEQAYQYMKGLGLDTQFANCQFAEVACNVMRFYVDLECNAFCDMVDSIDVFGKLTITEEAKAQLRASREKRGIYNNKRAVSVAGVNVTATIKTATNDSGDRLKKLLGIGKSGSGDSKQRADAKPFMVAPELCVALSNVEEARFKLDELLSSFGDLVDAAAKHATAVTDRQAKNASFEELTNKIEAAARDRQMQEILAESFEALSRETFQHLSMRRGELTELLAGRIQVTPVALVRAATLGGEFGVKAICAHYDEQWSVMATALRHKTFGELQQKMWLSLLAAMQERLLADVRCITEESLDELVSYFHGDGQGQATEWLNDKAGAVRRLAKYNAMTTYELIKIYYSCKRAIELGNAAPAAAATTDEAPPSDTALGLSASASADERLAAFKENQQQALTIVTVRAKLDGADGTPGAEDKEARAFIKEWEAAEKKLRKSAAPAIDAKPGAAAAAAAGAPAPSKSAMLQASAMAGAAKEQRQSHQAAAPLSKEEKLRHKFLLPPSEIFIDNFTCRQPRLPGSVGTLYVTTSHVCYAVRFGDDDDESTKDTMVFTCDAIVTLRIKSGLIASTLLITAFNSAGVAVEYAFDRFPNAKKAMALIVQRGQAMKHEIDVIE
jgi:hypothetical protein